MTSESYWERAALLREIAVQDGATYTVKDVLRLYDEALGDINTEIKKIYANFRRRYGLDEQTAAYFLDRSQEEENLKSLVQLLENAPNEQARRDILEYIHRDGLSVRAYAARAERYNAVKQVIYTKIKELAVKETNLVGNMKRQAYQESYYGMVDDIAKGFDVGINFALLNEDAIDEAVNAKWHGKRFSTRIWDNTDRLADEAQELVIKGLMSGESHTKTAAKLAESFGVEKYNAVTLIRTETAHIHAVADKKAYIDLGIEEYKYLATLDYKTCELCSPLDGKVFKVSDIREGVNYPTMHPRCRCTTTMNMKYTNRRARNPVTGRNELIDGSVTYEEWVNNMSPEQRHALETARKKDDNKTADKLQHAKYRKALGTKEVPRGFKEFQEMKYTNPQRYDEIKSLYRQANSVDKSARSGIIKSINVETAVKDVHYIGKIDKEIYQCVTKDIQTEDVIITNTQIKHIKEHHPNDYERFGKYFEEIVKFPDYIIEANKPNSALILKNITENNEQFKTVLRLATSSDNAQIKNSIITFMKIDKKEWDRLIRNKKILYKSE